MTDHARVVIIGGGAVGCSALYHLAQLGWTDCLLLERDELTSGSTWHAAGNCPNFSTSWNVIKLQRHSTRLYAKLGDAVDFLVDGLMLQPSAQARAFRMGQVEVVVARNYADHPRAFAWPGVNGQADAAFGIRPHQSLLIERTLPGGTP